MSQSKRFSYSCSQCDGPVTKPAVSTDKEGKMVHGLGGWKCPTHGAVSVKRTTRSNEN